MLISTANLTAEEIRDRFPDWIYRRLVELSKHEKIRHRDLWRYAMKTAQLPVSEDGSCRSIELRAPKIQHWEP
jgi:hypothetical protein